VRQRLRGKLGLVGIGLIAGSLFGGVAVAKIVIPAHSVGWNSLTNGLQKRINQAQLPGPAGPKGDTGATGPQGPAGEVPDPPEQPESPEGPEFSIPFIRSLAVSTITGHSAILEADLDTEGLEDGIYYQFQLVKDPADFRSEVTCPQKSIYAPPTISCLGWLSHEGGGDFHREPGDLPTNALFPDEDQHVRLEVQGLDPEVEYHYRVIAVEREQAVDTIQWVPPASHSPEKDFTTADIDSPRAYGWVAPFDENEEPLKRSDNALLAEPEGDPEGITCIIPLGIDPAKAVVQLTPVEEPHVTTEEVLPEVPIVRWQTTPIHCDEDQIEIETALYTGGGQNVPADLPFTFVIEEAR
jgi:hypothetical protein